MDTAYALIGKAIVEWSQLEQEIIRQIWRAKDPARASPFPPPIEEFGFRPLWRRWRTLHAPAATSDGALKSFEEDLFKYSEIRNDICHSAFEVVAHDRLGFSVGVHRRELSWPKKFKKWSDKWAKADARTRPPPPGDLTVRYYESDLVSLRKIVTRARVRCAEFSDALHNGAKIS